MTWRLLTPKAPIAVMYENDDEELKTVPVTELTEAELEDLAASWKENLFLHAGKFKDLPRTTAGEVRNP